MRLTARDVSAIKQAVGDVLGDETEVRLFGSRVDDSARGGDVDLMVTVDHAVENPAWAMANVERKLVRELGERKVDIVLKAPNLETSLIHQLAQEKGVLL